MTTPRTRGLVLHELRSPVTAIMGFAETLQRAVERGTATPERLTERLQRIRAAAERINGLLDELQELESGE